MLPAAPAPPVSVPPAQAQPALPATPAHDPVGQGLGGAAALFRRRRKSLGDAEARTAVPGQSMTHGPEDGWGGADEELPVPPRTYDFHGEKVLIVDDDVRNVFALTSVLEQHGLAVLYAENGREGIEVLEQHDDVTVVLMDIMMPEMDGYATTSAIRRMPQFAGLPIIALTAKAMKGGPGEGHRFRCLRLRHQAGRTRLSAVGDGAVDARKVIIGRRRGCHSLTQCGGGGVGVLDSGNLLHPHTVSVSCTVTSW
ncbi:hypothetical protein GCM10020254_26250 [Streptomyces goshikiensis]